MKIPVFATIKSALSFFWSNRVAFLYMAQPPLVILAILYTFSGFDGMGKLSIGGVEMSQRENFGVNFSFRSTYNGFLGIIGLVVWVASFSLYSVAWHRSFLVPNEVLTIRDCYRWQKRHWVFLWSTIKIVLFMIPIGLAGGLFVAFSGFLAPVIGFFLVMFMGVIYSRFSLWLPASAIDQKHNMSEILALSKDNGIRLSLIIFLTGLVTGGLNAIASVLITFAAQSLSVIGDLTQSLLASFALLLITFAGLAVGVSALSVTYRKLSVLSSQDTGLQA